MELLVAISQISEIGLDFGADTRNHAVTAGQDTDSRAKVIPFAAFT
jgi:hypothetical protein